MATVIPIGAGFVAIMDENDPRKVQAIIAARKKFIMAYCTEKGWPLDAEKLSWEQILEIREQHGWQHPTTL